MLIVDLKGDDSLLHPLAEATRRAGRRFRFFTNRLGRSSHAFNPIAELQASGLPLSHSGEALLSGLNLEHGSDYGASYFSSITRGLMFGVTKAFPGVRSIAELQREVERTRPTLTPAQKRMREQGHELMLAIEMLAEVPELNVTEGAAFIERIACSRAVPDDEVLYFSLIPKPREAIARFIGCLAVETFYMALVRHNYSVDEHGIAIHPRKQTWAVLDEFQVLAGRNWEYFMEAARSSGLGLILASQVPAKLKHDLRVVAEENVGVRHHCSARNADDVEALVRMGGTTIEVSGRDHDGDPQFREVPRLSGNIVHAVSAQQSRSVLTVRNSEGFAQFNGLPVVVRAPHCHNRDTYQEFVNRPWPTGEGLLVVGQDALPIQEHGGARRGAGGAAPEATPAGEPDGNTELGAALARIVVADHGYSVVDDSSSGTGAKRR